MAYKRLTHKNGETIEEYCEVGHCKYADFRVCNFKSFEHNVEYECVPAMIERLAELEDKIEQGTLIELPCKVGDIFYEVIQGLPIQEWKVYAIFWSTTYGNNYVIDGERQIDLAHWKFWREDFGENLFLTREEAEKKLEELRK